MIEKAKSLEMEITKWEITHTLVSEHLGAAKDKLDNHLRKILTRESFIRSIPWIFAKVSLYSAAYFKSKAFGSTIPNVPAIIIHAGNAGPGWLTITPEEDGVIIQASYKYLRDFFADRGVIIPPHDTLEFKSYENLPDSKSMLWKKGINENR